MNKPKFLFKTFLFLLILSIAAGVFAQTENRQPPADPSYEVVLQILVASNSAAGARSAVQPSLAGVVKKLKTDYDFSDYRLVTTFLQRTSNTIEYKSLFNDYGTTQDKNTPVFSDWSLRNLRELPAANGRRAIQFESFRFGARVPIASVRVNEENGRTTPVVNYESIGITTTRVSLKENEPTVIGSLATATPDEMMFLVLTVKSVE